MIVRNYNSLSSLQPYRAAWDRLAGDCAFRSWTWLSTWWRHYGGDGDAATPAERDRARRLHVLLVFEAPAERSPEADSETLVGVFPCYWSRSLTRGRMLRLLGDGEVCSDHLGVLADAHRAADVAAALAAHLAADSSWDLIDFADVDDRDHATAGLFGALAAAGCRAASYAAHRTWSIALPADWEQFLALQSKSHRKQLRQAERRVLDRGDAVWRPVTALDQFDAAWSILIDLHQRRRQSLGEPGCFASPAWAAFHRDVAPRMLADGRLRLSWLELGGSPAAAEYHLAGAHATYAYQGGVDPLRLAEEPGRLSTIRCIQQAIAQGHSQFDLLRGDEPYKAHWRAEPHGTRRWQAAAPRTLARLRRGSWAGARRAAQLARQLSALFTLPTTGQA
ncbi:MAG TPA: GNAT family N-acetyltransferase [Lacipirellulaceae bacterium]|nr:GNAT family N-acetyltransferase [Lacipirellulaceae bacterium]